MKKKWVKILCLVVMVSTGIPMIGINAQISENVSNVGVDLNAVTLDENALYNGIVIPSDWSDKHLDPLDGTRLSIPYLIDADKGGYAPEIINIDVGRQLFVDDFLIDSTELTTTYHTAKTLDEPIFVGDQSWENTSSVLTSGGVWYDMKNDTYKMWYQAGFAGKMAYATSTDGIHWERSKLKADGSNIVLDQAGIASSSVWMDYDAPLSERYKMMIRLRDVTVGEDAGAQLYVSSNGTYWKPVKNSDGTAATTGPMNDRSTFFYDALNGEWRFSLRVNTLAAWGDICWDPNTRVRYIHSGSTWLEAAEWDHWESETSDNVAKYWMKTDPDDPMDPYVTSLGDPKEPQLYNVDAIAYESVMIGLQQVWYGPGNGYISRENTPKITEIQASYSRDGFYYDRPLRGLGEGNALIPASRTVGTWDYGYLSTTTGGIIVYDDEIRIYYSAIAGQYGEEKGAYTGGGIGYATLRRDGFASLDGSGTVTTNPLTVTKAVKYLFVNAKTDGGSIKAEILDTDGNVLSGYSAADCVAFTGDSCCTKLTWNGAGDLSFLKGKGFRIRFTVENGEFYSFWLSADPEGASGGEVGAGYAGEKELDPDLSVYDTDTEPVTDVVGEDEKRGCKSSLGAAVPAVATLAAIPAIKRTVKPKRKKKEGR